MESSVADNEHDGRMVRGLFLLVRLEYTYIIILKAFNLPIVYFVGHKSFLRNSSIDFRYCTQNFIRIVMCEKVSSRGNDSNDSITAFQVITCFHY